MRRILTALIILTSLFGLAACGDDDASDDPVAQEDDGLDAVQTYFDDLGAAGQGDYFVSTRAALLFVQNICEDPDAHTPDEGQDAIFEVAKKHCDNSALMAFDVRQLKAQKELRAEPAAD